MDDSDWYSAEVYVRGTNLLAKFSKQSGNVKTDYRYYTQNAHGDVVNLTDAQGAITKSYKYDAFGVEQNINDADANAFRYCGEYYDAETGTIYLRARYYDPTIGRFISRDSYAGKNEDPLSLNLYTYCYNNPIIYTDITGNNPLIIAGLVLTATDIALMACIVALAALAIYSTTPSGQQTISNATTAAGEVVGDARETVGEWRRSASEALKKHRDIIKAGIGIGITSIAQSSTLEKTKQKKDNKEIEVYLAERNFSLTGPTIHLNGQITEEEAINIIINNGSEGVYTKKKSDAEYLARKASERMNKPGFVLHNDPQKLNRNQEMAHYHAVLSSGKEGRTHVWFGNIRQRRRAN